MIRFAMPLMKNYGLFLAVILLQLYGCSPKINQGKGSVPMAPADWYAYTKDHKYNDAGEAFSVTDSLIRLYGEKPGYLMSKKNWSNFELSLEYRWNIEKEFAHGTGKKNSGVMYNIPDSASDVLWPAGIQFQVKEGATGDFILLENVTLKVRGETKPAGKSVAVARLSEQDHATGEWNTLMVRSVNGKCEQYLNGILVNEGTEASSAGGRILLQYEGAPVDFRRVTVKQL